MLTIYAVGRLSAARARDDYLGTPILLLLAVVDDFLARRNADTQRVVLMCHSGVGGRRYNGAESDGRKYYLVHGVVMLVCLGDGSAGEPMPSVVTVVWAGTRWRGWRGKLCRGVKFGLLASLMVFWAGGYGAPCRGEPIGPNHRRRLPVRNTPDVTALKALMERKDVPHLIGAFRERRSPEVHTCIDDICRIGTLCHVLSVKPHPEDPDGLLLNISPSKRVALTELIPTDPPSTVGTLVEFPDLPFSPDDPRIKALAAELIAVFREIARVDNQSLAAWEQQDILETRDVRERMEKALVLLKEELAATKLKSARAKQKAVTKPTHKPLKARLEGAVASFARFVRSIIARFESLWTSSEPKESKPHAPASPPSPQQTPISPQQPTPPTQQTPAPPPNVNPAKYADEEMQRLLDDSIKLRLSPIARRTFNEELDKLASMRHNDREAQIVRTYLRWITNIPWETYTTDNLSVKHAKKVLDGEHHGLGDVKNRILEFLAVGRLRGSLTPNPNSETRAPSTGKILLLSGPPGVGKTSIAKSIAGALGRKFYRLSIGGALPGKIVYALKTVGTSNPLILIDELDKVGGANHHGDPSSVLLEMLDPEQNHSFTDHYMEFPIDLSSVLFICTANTVSSIAPPLQDRMEIIEVPGYVTADKMAIATRYLEPAAREAAGLAGADVRISEDAVRVLIGDYCRESGVRGLKRAIEKVYRKAAFKIVQDVGEDEDVEELVSTELVPETAAQPTEPLEAHEETRETVSADETAFETTFVEDPVPPPPPPTSPEHEQKPAPVKRAFSIPEDVHVRITPENLVQYVGQPVWSRERLYNTTGTSPPPGTCTGLGFTGNGSGALTPVEVVCVPGKGQLRLTGKLGEVIRESVQIAVSWVENHADALGICVDEKGKPLLHERDLHVHMPQGGIGKDGPSAGVAFVTALVSLFTKTGVSPDIAMTGEISLGGRVLPVGGLQEKILAANREGIKTVIVPAGNRGKVEEDVPQSVKEGIRLVYVEDVREVLHEVFAGELVAERWKEMLPVQQKLPTMAEKESKRDGPDQVEEDS
ncbi:Lon protease-like protein, mitochondrial [Mycena kentingensis (nom. inval.)]|nr:Lon protease-like protein, mitochondrial [Mycena kentingensis (nom. inval.)]